MPLNRQSDKMLLLMLKRDENTAFSEIYCRYWEELYETAYKGTRDKAQCQDILQNIFADLWRRRHQLSINNLSAYLHTAVRFQVYKFLDRVSTRVTYIDEFENITSSSPTYADDALRESEMLDWINIWLVALPQKRKKIFQMYYMEGVPTSEIAGTLDISQNTVQAQLYTAYQSLRDRLKYFMSR